MCAGGRGRCCHLVTTRVALATRPIRVSFSLFPRPNGSAHGLEAGRIEIAAEEVASVGLFDRFRRRKRAGETRLPTTRDTSHLEAWAATRRGVEAYVEPRTTMTETTVVLVAHDGEWTRRRIDGPEGAARLGRKLGIPVYDVGLIGYPQRMRDYTSRLRAAQREPHRQDHRDP
jgi:hypothetical protein